ncbi:MAG: SDR family NAD(P)-dependent oxidoreductase [Planctomycetes bacterium]|nr:SDR family NAD(P)-dependent oxidoreductase [Planctomycetota bacterium]
MKPSEAHSAIALVTGASSGMGAAIARRLAARGWVTLLLARRADKLAAVADDCRSHAPSHALPFDLSDTEALPAMMHELMTTHGSPTVLVNGAGSGMYGRFLDQTTDTEDYLHRLNYLAPSRLIRETLPSMLRQRRGHVINIASISAKMSPWGHATYTPTKSALVALTQTLAADYADSGVHFSYVHPGVVNTPYFHTSKPMELLWNVVRPHAIEPDTVARHVVNLLDHPKLELCVPRGYRILDYLKALSPTHTHRLVARNSKPKSDGA